MDGDAPGSARAALEQARLRRSLRGYDPREVDAFVAGIRSRLDDPASAPTGDEVRAVEFHLRWRGYVVDDVDALLDSVAAALDRR